MLELNKPNKPGYNNTEDDPAFRTRFLCNGAYSRGCVHLKRGECRLPACDSIVDHTEVEVSFRSRFKTISTLSSKCNTISPKGYQFFFGSTFCGIVTVFSANYTGPKKVLLQYVVCLWGNWEVMVLAMLRGHFDDYFCVSARDDEIRQLRLIEDAVPLFRWARCEGLYNLLIAPFEYTATEIYYLCVQFRGWDAFKGLS